MSQVYLLPVTPAKSYHPTIPHHSLIFNMKLLLALTALAVAAQALVIQIDVAAEDLLPVPNVRPTLHDSYAELTS